MKCAAPQGAAADPAELKACARVSRAGALCSGPRIETYGLAEVCRAHTPAASTKMAVRVMGKLTMLAAGVDVVIFCSGTGQKQRISVMRIVVRAVVPIRNTVANRNGKGS